MTPSLWLRLDVTARRLVPAALSFALLLAGSIPMTASHVQVLKPALPLAAVYYWSLYRPDLMPAPVVFVLGLFYDILGGAPVGVHAVVFVVLHAVVNKQRRFLIGKSFAISWMGFALVATGAFSLVWLLTSIYYATPVEPPSLLFQALTTILLFPVVFWVLLRCHIVLLQQV